MSAAKIIALVGSRGVVVVPCGYGGWLRFPVVHGPVRGHPGAAADHQQGASTASSLTSSSTGGSEEVQSRRGQAPRLPGCGVWIYVRVPSAAGCWLGGRT